MICYGAGAGSPAIGNEIGTSFSGYVMMNYTMSSGAGPMLTDKVASVSGSVK